MEYETISMTITGTREKDNVHDQMET